MTPALILAFYRRARSRGFTRAQARRWALSLLPTVTLLVTVGCAAPDARPARPHPLAYCGGGVYAVDCPAVPPALCRPNHSGVCEGPAVAIDTTLVRRIQARDTTNGRDIEL